jgi:hypothetical protein
MYFDFFFNSESPGRVLRASPRCNHGPGGVNKRGRSSTQLTSFASSPVSSGRKNEPEKGVMSDQRNGIVASRREYVNAVSLVLIVSTMSAQRIHRLDLLCLQSRGTVFVGNPRD